MKRERKREVDGSERHYRGWERKEFIIGFEGSQAVLARPSGRGKAFDRYYKQQSPWPLVRKRTILTERPPLVGEI
jgi:hypothetical protein